MRLRESADWLQRALDSQRLALAGVSGEEHNRRAEAIDRLAQYVSLLRSSSTTSAAPVAYSFKLEFPDGRWDVEEQRLDHAPAVGDVLELSGHGKWRVRGSQLVRPRPSHKPAREFFVCAPAA